MRLNRLCAYVHLGFGLSVFTRAFKQGLRDFEHFTCISVSTGRLVVRIFFGLSTRGLLIYTKCTKGKSRHIPNIQSQSTLWTDASRIGMSLEAR